MIRIAVTPAEMAQGALTADHLTAAVAAIAEDGMVVLENAIPHGPLDKLKVRMDADTRELQAFHDAH
ncbi:MAG TPA: hypothetical protein VJ998_08030, partial [Pseudomonadales bacterium]|nr:hypothetical protein [Pseudomonadales bacterium]